MAATKPWYSSPKNRSVYFDQFPLLFQAYLHTDLFHNKGRKQTQWKWGMINCETPLTVA